MKKTILAYLLVMPLSASANTLQFNAVGNNFKFNGYNSGDIYGPVAQTGVRNVGQFGSFSILGDGGGIFSATYLGDESGFNNNFSQNLSLGNQVLVENTIGSTVSANISGPGLIDFGFYSTNSTASGASVFRNGDAAGRVLGFAVLKDRLYNGNYSSVGAVGYNNNTSLGLFDFLIGFNDNFSGDSDYDDYVVGIKYTPNAVPVPAALPLLATAIGLFGFAANRRRV